MKSDSLTGSAVCEVVFHIARKSLRNLRNAFDDKRAKW